MACLEERLSSLSPTFALSPALPSHSRDDNDCVALVALDVCAKGIYECSSSF